MRGGKLVSTGGGGVPLATDLISTTPACFNIPEVVLGSDKLFYRNKKFKVIDIMKSLEKKSNTWQCQKE